jgi:hypothetical protein
MITQRGGAGIEDRGSGRFVLRSAIFLWFANSRLIGEL